MTKNEVEFNVNVENYLHKKGPVRRETLINYLIEANGYSRSSVERKLTNLKKQGVIVVLNTKEEFDKFGIKEEDKRSAYITTKDSFERKRHIDKVFEYLENGDDIDIESALAEIKRYEKLYVMDSKQLDNLVTILGDTANVKIVDNILSIIYKHVIIKEIVPSDEENLLQVLQNLLYKFPEGHPNHSMLRRHILRLLGYYEDRAVIEKLIKDTENGQLSQFKNDYLTNFTSKVIEEGRIELFELEIKLRKTGDKNTAETLNKIRNYAIENLTESGIKNPLEASNGGNVDVQFREIRGIKK